MKEQLISGLENSLTYQKYMDLMEKLVLSQSTTGEIDQSRVEFTALNLTRSQRLNKKLRLQEPEISFFKELRMQQTWLVITESWCGDAAQTLPVLNKLAEASENLDLRVIMRDEHPELMDHFLTNGTRSIPKLIILNSDLDVIATWGPRSAAATKLVSDYKEKFGKIDAAFKTQLQMWYNKDKGASIINELIDIVGKAEEQERLLLQS
ncbi:thioredoxin family protein [Salinimicrobium xinjiangense]|uniref:thioredoxin family protein n=1 Tax=Salinimicrobium xinjiangense TaxID=438596 RepID=UPI0004113701|nr:thioredoxin family protein [Salinimicrobium xinjiangense]